MFTDIYVYRYTDASITGGKQKIVDLKLMRYGITNDRTSNRACTYPAFAEETTAAAATTAHYSFPAVSHCAGVFVSCPV